MHQRLAIAISCIAAAVVLAVGLTAAGLRPVPRPSSADAAGEPTAAAGVDAQTARDEAEVVYVKPAPEPRTVVVTKQGRQSASTARRTELVRNTNRSRSMDDDDDDDRYERRSGRSESRRERDDDGERDWDDD